MLLVYNKYTVNEVSHFGVVVFERNLLANFAINHHHPHYVPSVVNRSVVMDFHRSRSRATLIQSLYDIFVHSLMLSVHIVLGLPRFQQQQYPQRSQAQWCNSQISVQ